MTLPAEQSGQPDPPQIDIPGRRLVLPRHLVPIALMLRQREAAGEGGPVPGREELDRAGITRGERLHPLAHRILGPVASPHMVVSVEVTEERRRFATIWSRRSVATLGTSHDPASFVLDELEAELLPFHLAAITRLGPRPLPKAEPIVVAPVDLAGIPTRGSERARRTSAGVGGDFVEDLRAASRRRWTVSTLRLDTEGSVVDSSLEAIDAGPLGYWEVTPLATDRVVLTPRRLDSVLRLLADAMPAN